jgi:hypothetical protein
MTRWRFISGVLAASALARHRRRHARLALRSSSTDAVMANGLK